MDKLKTNNIQLSTICQTLEQAFKDFDEIQKSNLKNIKKDPNHKKQAEVEATFKKLKTLIQELS